MNTLSRVAATFFGIGYFPAAPGTVATIAGIGAVFIFKDTGLLYAAVIVALFFIGLAASTYLEEALGEKDPGIIVIDEVVGIMIALAGLPFGWPIAICGFFLFRAFDMFKIYPINKLESLPAGWGVMLDDVMAGVYTNIVLSIAVRWAGLV
jgi:phosphatidylglycerophosphatase A